MAVVIGLDNETIRAIVQGVVTLGVAGISGFVAWTISKSNARATRQLEADRRAYSDAGLRRKLSLLLMRAERALIRNMTLLAQEPDSWSQIVSDFRDYVMKPELASAVENEELMSALYEVLDAFEIANDVAQSLIRQARQDSKQYVEDSGECDEEVPLMWTDQIRTRMIGVYIPPARALLSYWSLTGRHEASKTIGVAIDQARASIASRPL